MSAPEIRDGTPGPPPEIAAGDPRRPAIGRAVFSTLLAAAVFFVFTAPVKQIAALYDHAPWLNDPYDTVVSFSMFLVPFITACCAVRVALCRRSESLPRARVFDLLRGCRVVLGAVSLTVLAQWTGVVLHANRGQWNAATALQIGLLVVTTGLTVRAVGKVLRVSTPSLPRQGSTGETSDWLTDFVALVQRQSHRLGVLREPMLRLCDWVDRRPLSLTRRHPLWVATAACGSFAVVIGVHQGFAEGYGWPVVALFIALLGCGTFGLVVGAGSYLGLVRSPTHLDGARRRLLDASVVTCVGVLFPFAFRYHLWWVVGSTDAKATIAQLLALLGVFGTSIFIGVFAVESALHRHPKARP